MSRERRTAVNRSQQYSEILEERGVQKITQLRTPTIKEISSKVSSFEYVWKNGDKFWLLSHKFYGNKKFWYIIAQFNNKPTESHVSVGESIQIPYDVHEVLQEMKK
jgi:nucleoid-associated protein YgaU